MEDKTKEILYEVNKYYSEKISLYGTTPRGVDWNGEEGQVLRFQQLCKIIDCPSSFSVNDLGCGYGALLEYLNIYYSTFTYSGFDVSENMIVTAKKRHSKIRNADFCVSSSPFEVADFSIASGIFNVRFERNNEDWWDYLCSTLDILNSKSLRGFSFNCLTIYSDIEKMKPYLYYADPCKLFDFCKRRYSKDVFLLHDYGLYEFTIGVKKEK